MNASEDEFPPARLWMQCGVILFMIGLFTGFFVPVLALPRMGLASHLEGVMNGLLLIVVGLMWGRLALGARQRRLCFALIVYAAYANWLATLLSAATGAAGAMPLAGGGSTGAPLQEAIVTGLLLTLSVSILIGAGFIAYGLRRVQTEK